MPTLRRHRLGAVAVLTALIALPACDADGGGAPATDEAPRPGSEYAQLTASGAWCWFGDPRGVRFTGTHDRVYVGWVDTEGSIVVSSQDMETGERTTATLALAFDVDDHANPSLLVQPDGTLVVFYTSHANNPGDEMFYHTSLAPEDVSGWSEARVVGTNTEGPRGHTYPNPARLSAEGGRIYLFWRGGNFKPTVSWTDDLESWAPAQTLIQSEESDVVRPYVKVDTDGHDRIDFAFTDGHPRNEPLNSIYYMRYRAGDEPGTGTFHRADGTAFGSLAELPLVHEEADLVYDASLTGARAWIWDVAADSDGNPVIVYTRHPEETDHRYHYARWDGARWSDVELTAAGGWFPATPEGETEPEPHYSGGIVLDHSDPSVVYLSRPVQGVFEIERWETPDGGATWRSRAVTAGSSLDNVRPYVVRGHGGASPTVMWMQNRRYRHYLDFDALLRMDLPAR